MILLYNIAGYIYDAIGIFIRKADARIAESLSRTELCEVGMVFQGVFLLPEQGVIYLGIQVQVSAFGVVHCFYSRAARPIFPIFQAAQVALLVLGGGTYLYNFAQLHTGGVIHKLDAVATRVSNNAGQVEVMEM